MNDDLSAKAALTAVRSVILALRETQAITLEQALGCAIALHDSAVELRAQGRFDDGAAVGALATDIRNGLGLD